MPGILAGPRRHTEVVCVRIGFTSTLVRREVRMTLASPSEPKPPHRRRSVSAIAHLAPTLLRLPDLTEADGPDVTSSDHADGSVDAVSTDGPPASAQASLEPAPPEFGNDRDEADASVPPPKRREETPFTHPPLSGQSDSTATTADRVPGPTPVLTPTPGQTPAPATPVPAPASVTSETPSRARNDVATETPVAPETPGASDAAAPRQSPPATAAALPSPRLKPAVRGPRSADGSRRVGRRSIMDVVSSRATLLLLLGLIGMYAVFGPRDDDSAERSAEQTAVELSIDTGSPVLAETDLPSVSTGSAKDEKEKIKENGSIELTAPQKFAAIDKAASADTVASSGESRPGEHVVTEPSESSSSPTIGFPATASIGPPITPQPFPVDRSEPGAAEMDASPFGSSAPGGAAGEGTPASTASSSTGPGAGQTRPKPIFSSTPRGIVDWRDFLPPVADGSGSAVPGSMPEKPVKADEVRESSSTGGMQEQAGTTEGRTPRPAMTRSPNEPNFQIQMPRSPTPALEASFPSAGTPDVRVASPPPSANQR